MNEIGADEANAPVTSSFTRPALRAPTLLKMGNGTVPCQSGSVSRVFDAALKSTGPRPAGAANSVVAEVVTSISDSLRDFLGEVICQGNNRPRPC